ncbi:MAG: DUF3473 domain-containing protein [Planctomycetales bacterium]
MLNAFTVDVEDYFQVSAFEDSVSRSDWDLYPSRVERNTRAILALLDAHAVSGTFFVLGWTARKFPGLVREIQQAGHEVGSHGFWHRLIYGQSPDEFRQDLKESRAVLEDVLGEPVRCYRAPSFSITKDCLWAFDVLAEEGFTHDGSVFPVRHDRYGIPDAPRFVHARQASVGVLQEFPASVLATPLGNLPVGGGGYFRLYPWRFTRWALSRINQSGRPFVFYVHPWEIDPDQPRLTVRSRLSRMRHYVNLRSTKGKLDRLLSAFQFGSFTAVAGEVSSNVPRRSLRSVPRSRSVTR